MEESNEKVIGFTAKQIEDENGEINISLESIGQGNFDQYFTMSLFVLLYYLDEIERKQRIIGDNEGRDFVANGISNIIHKYSFDEFEQMWESTDFTLIDLFKSFRK